MTNSTISVDSLQSAGSIGVITCGSIRLPDTETCFTWVLPYLNQKWTEQTDCYHWFARIQREVFGRDTPLIADADYRHQWQVTAKPSDGDAVIMYSHARDVRLHHIGVWHDADGGGVVHAQTGGCVCFDSLTNLAQQQWTIREFLTPCQ